MPRLKLFYIALGVLFIITTWIPVPFVLWLESTALQTVMQSFGKLVEHNAVKEDPAVVRREFHQDEAQWVLVDDLRHEIDLIGKIVMTVQSGVGCLWLFIGIRIPRRLANA